MFWSRTERWLLPRKQKLSGFGGEERELDFQTAKRKPSIVNIFYTKRQQNVAREASVQYKELSLIEIAEVLNRVRGKLSFHVVLPGHTSDFAENYHAVLKYKEKVVQPTYKENPKQADLLCYESGNPIYSFLPIPI